MHFTPIKVENCEIDLKIISSELFGGWRAVLLSRNDGRDEGNLNVNTRIQTGWDCR